MPDPLFGLSAGEVMILKRMLQSYNNRTVNTPNRPSPPEADWEEDHQTEVHSIKTPSTGIPALTGDFGDSTPAKPGWAMCDVYRVTFDVDSGEWLLTQSVVPQKRVFNYSRRAIPPDLYTTVKRDKFGQWVIDSHLPELAHNFCVVRDEATGYLTDLRVTWLKADGVTTSCEDVDDCPGCDEPGGPDDTGTDTGTGTGEGPYLLYGSVATERVTGRGGETVTLSTGESEVSDVSGGLVFLVSTAVSRTATCAGAYEWSFNGTDWTVGDTTDPFVIGTDTVFVMFSFTEGTGTGTGTETGTGTGVPAGTGGGLPGGL